MRNSKIISILLAVILILPVLAIGASADDYAVNFTASASPAEAAPGGQVELVVSLTGYTEEVAATDAIRGLQVDVYMTKAAGMLTADTTASTSLIDDSTAMSNTVSYNKSANSVRLVYFNMTGTLPAPCEGVLKAVFTVNSELTGSGSTTLPVRVLIQTMSGKQITLNSDCTISYSDSSSEVTSVDIVWGAMEFEYTDGVWNTESHSYEGSGWTDNDSGFVKLTNNGSTAAQAEFSYKTDRSDISGSFTDGTSPVTDAVSIDAGGETTVYLVLSGKPTGTMDKATLGSVTVLIGGD